jgi:hypothetical protein
VLWQGRELTRGAAQSLCVENDVITRQGSELKGAVKQSLFVGNDAVVWHGRELVSCRCQHTDPSALRLLDRAGR